MQRKRVVLAVLMPPTTKVADSAILGTLDPKFKEKPLVRYGFQYAIPASQIAFANSPNGIHKGAMELDIAAYDGDGHLVTGLSQTVQMPLSDAKYQQFIVSVRCWPGVHGWVEP